MAWVEDVNRRGQKVKHYLDSDNPTRHQAVFTIHDQHYKDASDQWQDVNENIVDDGLGGFAKKSETTRHTIRFGNGGQQRWYPRRNVAIEYVGITNIQYWRTTGGGSWRNLNLPTPVWRNQGAEWDMANLYASLTNTWSQIKSDFILKDDTAPTRLRFQIELIGLTLNTDTWELTSIQDGLVWGSIPPPTAYYNTTNPNTLLPIPVNVPVTATYTVGFIEWSVDTTGVTYPVYVDPTLRDGEGGTVHTDKDTKILQGAATTNYGTNQNIQTGMTVDQIDRALMQFNMSSIAAGSTCNSATLALYGEAADSWSRTHKAYELLSGRSDWAEDQATWNIYKTGSNWGTAGCSNTSTDRSTTELASWASTSGADTDIALNTTQVAGWFGATNTNYGFLIKDSVEEEWQQNSFGSSDNVTTSHRPYLIVDYTEGGAVDATVTAVVVNSIYRAQVITPTATVQVDAVLGTGIYSAQIATVTGENNATVTAVLGTGIWTGQVAVLSATGSITGALGTGIYSAQIATVTGENNATVTAVLGTGIWTGQVAVLTATGSITGVLGTGILTAQVAVLSATGSVTGALGAGIYQAQVATVTGGEAPDATIDAVLATGILSAKVAVIHASTELPYSDSFTDTNGVQLYLHAPKCWMPVTGYPNDLEIRNNAISPDASGANQLDYVLTASLPDPDQYVILHHISTTYDPPYAYAGPAVRIDPDNFYCYTVFMYQDETTDVVRLGCFDGDGFTLLGIYDGILYSTDWLTLVADGDQIVVRLVQPGVVDEEIIRVTDTRLASGYVGVFGYGDNTGTSWDDFTGGEVESATITAETAGGILTAQIATISTTSSATVQAELGTGIYQAQISTITAVANITGIEATGIYQAQVAIISTAGDAVVSAVQGYLVGTAQAATAIVNSGITAVVATAILTAGAGTITGSSNVIAESGSGVLEARGATVSATSSLTAILGVLIGQAQPATVTGGAGVSATVQAEIGLAVLLAFAPTVSARHPKRLKPLPAIPIPIGLNTIVYRKRNRRW